MVDWKARTIVAIEHHENNNNGFLIFKLNDYVSWKNWTSWPNVIYCDNDYPFNTWEAGDQIEVDFDQTRRIYHEDSYDRRPFSDYDDVVRMRRRVRDINNDINIIIVQPQPEPQPVIVLQEVNGEQQNEQRVNDLIAQKVKEQEKISCCFSCFTCCCPCFAACCCSKKVEELAQRHQTIRQLDQQILEAQVQQAEIQFPRRNS